MENLSIVVRTYVFQYNCIHIHTIQEFPKIKKRINAVRVHKMYEFARIIWNFLDFLAWLRCFSSWIFLVLIKNIAVFKRNIFPKCVLFTSWPDLDVRYIYNLLKLDFYTFLSVTFYLVCSRIFKVLRKSLHFVHKNSLAIYILS